MKNELEVRKEMVQICFLFTFYHINRHTTNVNLLKSDCDSLPVRAKRNVDIRDFRNHIRSYHQVYKRY